MKKLGKFMLVYCDEECNDALKAYFSYQGSVADTWPLAVGQKRSGL